MPQPSAAQAKLIQYLNEAHGTEKRLETALTAHLTMATRATYRKRLQQHLSETKRHGRDVSKRIKQLGGKVDASQAPGPEFVTEAAQSVVAAGQRAVALAQGPLHALRGTGEAEKQLKNAKTEYASEAEEIATYTAIEALADALGDRDTKKLARGIRREEQRMSSFLEKEIPRMTAAVVKDEVPASERSNGRSASRTTTRRRSTARSSATASASSGRAAAKAKPASRGAAKAKPASRGAAKAKPSSGRTSKAKPASRSASSSGRASTTKTSSGRSSSGRSSSSAGASPRGAAGRSGGGGGRSASKS